MPAFAVHDLAAVGALVELQEEEALEEELQELELELELELEPAMDGCAQATSATAMAAKVNFIMVLEQEAWCGYREGCAEVDARESAFGFFFAGLRERGPVSLDPLQLVSL